MAEKEITIVDMSVTEESVDTSIKETIQIIEVEDVGLFTVETQEAFPAVGAPNEQLNHSLLNNRELPNQHPIIAIEGLEQKLEQIEALQTVYSDKKLQADYYMWHQDNEHLFPDNPYGLFVSIHPETNHIRICAEDGDVFGVTVSEAAFVGGQEYVKADKGNKTGRDGNYCLVVYSGLVGVRCETTVVVGDYVAPNVRGEAQKTGGNYGYLVTALSEVNGEQYAIISLSAQSRLAKVIADDVQDLSGRVSTAEYNITSVTNVANSAYAIAKDAQETADVNSEYIEDKVSEVIDRLDKTDGIVGNLSESVNNASTNAALAKTIAEGAVSSAEAIRSEAVTKANEANANVSNLMKNLEPITTWEDPDTGNKGAEYLASYINNGLATKVEVQAVEDKTEENYTAIQQNAKSIQSLASKIDKYAVGEYSQAYGLTHEQAKAILDDGYVYVPTTVHSETYGDYTQEFSLGYYYTWNGEGWMPSQSIAVSFSNVHINGSERSPYWVVTIADVEIKEGENVVATYEVGGLYKWENGDWIKVASMADNVLSRAISLIKQTTDSIEASVQDVKGSMSALELRVDNTESSVTTLASHVIGDYIAVQTWDETGKDVNKIYLASDTNLYWYYADGAWQSTASSSEAGLTGTLATIEQKADENGASIAQVVSAVGKDGEVTASSIVQAINDGKSSVSISGDCINLTGKVTFSSFDDDTKRKIEADTIDVQIWSDRGNIFKGRDITTTLTCHVFQAGVDITSTLPNSAFTWEKINHDGTKDESWSATPYGNHVNAIQITSADVWSRAVFNCAVEI